MNPVPVKRTNQRLANVKLQNEEIVSLQKKRIIMWKFFAVDISRSLQVCRFRTWPLTRNKKLEMCGVVISFKGQINQNLDIFLEPNVFIKYKLNIF